MYLFALANDIVEVRALKSSSPSNLTCLNPAYSCAQMVKAQSVIHFLQYLPWAGEYQYIIATSTALQRTCSVFRPTCVRAEWAKLATADAHIPPLSDANGRELCTYSVALRGSQLVF